MEFKSLSDALSNNFIKSLPHLTRLDLTGNEIKIIELVLSFTQNGLNFYMNHAAIADYLVLKDTKTKAKSVGNIIGCLKRKGYISSTQSFNFNGKNGGSSATIIVNEAFLEAHLHAAFNPVSPLTDNPPQTVPVLDSEPTNLQEKNPTPSASADAQTSSSKIQTAAEFVAELEAMDDAPQEIPNLPWVVKSDDTDDAELIKQEDYGYMEFETIEGFQSLLKGLIGFDVFYHKRGMLQHMIDNTSGWSLEELKEAFGEVILK